MASRKRGRGKVNVMYLLPSQIQPLILASSHLDKVIDIPWPTAEGLLHPIFIHECS